MSVESRKQVAPVMSAPQVVLQVRVLEARNLMAKDKHTASSDPFVTIKFGSQRVTTSTVDKNLNPKWNDGPFTFVINRSAMEANVNSRPKKNLIRVKVWDKDAVGRDFLGQVRFSVVDLISSPHFRLYDDPLNEPVAYNLEPRSKSEKVSGEILLKFGYAPVSTSLQSTSVADVDQLDAAQQASAVPLDEAVKMISLKEVPFTPNEPFMSVSAGTPVGEDDYDPLAGVLCMEVVAANNLPKKRSAVLPRFDMDPFVVISFGKRTFRTRHVRHSLNPQWNEKMYIRVHESDLHRDYPVIFAVWDHDRLSLHNYVGRIFLKLSDIIAESSQTPLEGTRERDSTRLGFHEFITKTFPVPLDDGKSSQDCPPVLTLRWRYIEARELRRNFVWSLARIFDSDESGALNRIEIQAMLEQLGSSLSETTIKEFFEKFNKDYSTGELAFDELAECLEQYVSSHTVRLLKSGSNKPTRAGSQHSLKSVKGSTKGLAKLLKSSASSIRAGTLNSTPNSDSSMLLSSTPAESSPVVSVYDNASSSGSDLPASSVNSTGCVSPSTAFSKLSGQANLLDASSSTEAGSENEEEERLFHITGCFICGKNTVSSHYAQDLDIISHIALCAHDDLSKVDSLVLGGFLTEAQASRKWYVKLLQYISYGNYHVGSRSGVILVLDRATGQLIDEKMPVYIRMGIRLMYQSAAASNAVQSKMSRRLLYKMSVKQGRKFDDPKSVKAIKRFIKFHQLDTDEVLEPLSSFKSFNEFFYRKLKPGARVLSSPNDPTVLVSPADCRMNCFRSVTSATNLWIKGRDFSVENLLNNESLSKFFDGGALAVSRLAPQDYHRFHCPVDGVLVSINIVGGTYYTVNPMAIRTSIDVFSENRRSIALIDSPDFGKVAYVCVGAMMVGSIVFTAKVGDKLSRMDEIGYFAFGGSSILMLFEPGKVQFDKDLIKNSEQSLETLVKVGNSIGKRV